MGIIATIVLAFLFIVIGQAQEEQLLIIENEIENEIEKRKLELKEWNQK